jgi:hypothetical protein
VPELRLDIGCGAHKADGWIGMDCVALPGVDVVHDMLCFPWPFEDESVVEARAEMVVEHIPHLCWCCRNEKDPFFAFFDEAYRVLAPGALFHVICPHSDSRRAWRDPTHTRGINHETAFYLNRDSREKLGVGHYDTTCNFDAQWSFALNEHGEVMDIHFTFTKR